MGMQLVCGCLLFSMQFAAFCEDWPHWRGLSRDGKSPETGLLKQWPEEGPKLAWATEVLGKGYSSVSVAGGFVYTTGMIGENNEGVLFAFDLSGNLMWRQPYGPEWDKTYPGTRYSPTVDGDRVYVLSAKALLTCFDVKTGAIKWAKDVAKEFGAESPRCGFAEAAVVDAGNVICTPGGKDASLVALDKMTGRTVWTTKGLSDLSGYCVPILIERGGRRLLITITARHLAGIDPKTGEVVWKQPFDPDAEDPNHSVAPVYENGCIYLTSGHRKGGLMFELAPDGGQVTLKWSDQILNTLHGGMVLVDGYIYGTNTKGMWVCLDLKTGKVMYEAEGVGMGSLVYADGMLYCYGEKGTLALVKASPSGCEIVSSFKVTPGEAQHWAHPVISGGRLYIRHGSALMAYEIKAE